MRLRLRIERNELPAVSILWTIGDTELKQTVAQFVERVNERFPLEGESWGLEDYAVTVGGYEALHYNEVGTCFQHEDEVLIKPLQYVDSRARTITGRNQILENGMHILDGVPFGRPLLKRARRPVVNIPPRKRQRVEEGAAAENGDDEDTALVRFEELDEDEDEDDESDEDFDISTWNEGDEEEDGSEDDADAQVQQELAKATRNAKRVKFADSQKLTGNGNASTTDPQEAASSDDSSDESDEDVSSDSSASSSDDSESDSEESSDDDSSDSSEEEWNGITSSDPSSPRKRQPMTNGTAKPIQTTLANGSASNSPKQTPPHEGDSKTKLRNARRREQRQLKHLKENGMLAENATMEDMRQMMESKGLTRGLALKETARARKLEAAREKLLGDIAAGGVDIATKIDVPREDDDEPPDEEPIKAAKSSIKELPNDAGAGLQDDQTTTTLIADSVLEEEPAAVDPSVTQRRKRLDVASTNRHIFASLGVRTPRTQADKDALQKKLLTRSQRAVPAERPAKAAEDAEQAEEDSDAWKDRIDISAVECCDEGVVLSAPPFPFKQRWDPQYQIEKRKPTIQNSKASKRRKRQASDGEYLETYDKYNTDGTGDALNYDDPVDEDDDEYWEDGALLGDDYEDESEVVDDGFPQLPADMSTLSALAEADATKGDYIVYTELSCSAATGWEPKMTVRTARLDEQEGDSWKVTYAQRDLPPKEYDEDGNRVYSKFEMEGGSDDGEDERTALLQWAVLQEPKLLLRPTV